MSMDPPSSDALGPGKALLTSLIVFLGWFFVVGWVSFLWALLGMFLFTPPTRQVVSALIAPRLRESAATNSETLGGVPLELSTPLGLGEELYVIVAWIASAGLSMLTFAWVPRFHLACCLLAGVLYSLGIMLGVRDLALPSWVATVAVIGVIGVAFAVARLTSQAVICEPDWLFQVVGRGKKKDSERPGLSSSDLRHVWILKVSALYMVGFVAWIGYLVVVKTGWRGDFLLPAG